MDTNKIIGYVLLVVGILIIILPLWQTYNVFTGQSVPAQIFAMPTPLKVDSNVNPTDVQGQIQNALIKIFPVSSINNTLNLVSWMLLIFIFIYGGGKIAGIGVKLLNGSK